MIDIIGEQLVGNGGVIRKAIEADDVGAGLILPWFNKKYARTGHLFGDRFTAF